MTKIINPIETKKVLDLPGICGRMFYHSEQLELVELSIEAGKSIASHQMPIDVIFYLLDGELEFIIDDEIVPIKASEVIEIKALRKRTVNNKTSQNAKVLVIKPIKQTGVKL